MRTLVVPICAGFLMLASCSGTAPEQKKQAEKPPEPVSGQTALFKMFQVARAWAPDLQVLRMNSIVLSEVPGVPAGTGAAWQATFTSEAHSQARSYTYSVVESIGNLHKGVYPGQEESWTRGKNTPFPIAAVKIDTDAAYKTALANGGEEYDKKNPGKPISFVLEKIEKYPNPAWRVLWGESAGTANFSVYVDATTGNYLEKMH